MTKYLLSFLCLMMIGAEAIAQPPAGAANAPRSETRAPVSLAAFTQGMKKQDGFFPFYYDEKSGKVYLEIHEFDKEFLYFLSLSNGVGNGGPERGQATSAMAKFVKIGPKILLVEPVTNYRAITTNKDEIGAVENNFAKSVVYGFVPVAVEGDTFLIDITPFIIRDSQNLTARLGVSRVSGPVAVPRAAAPSASYRLDETRSVVYLPNTKNFPKNTELESMLTFTGGAPANEFGRGAGLAPDPSAITINLHQSFVELPDNNYATRKFDARSAFQLFSYMDFSAPMDEPLVKRFIRRHRLQKKDPDAAISEAVKPIIYYVDRGAPGPIKKALIEGGAWWNQAFETAGFKDAFQVKELPEGADPMDIRYNIVNWINRSGYPARAFSSGASFTDPRTGEIIKGVVTLGSDRHRQDYLIAEGLLQPYVDGKPVTKQMEEMALSRVRQLSAHEIGHTLGFNHNFAASPKERASVMDYPFPRFSIKGDTIDLSDAYAKGIGSWDKRAVLWGYSEFKKGTDENKALDDIMKETLKQGFAYIPDIGGNTHPMSNQWEDGANPIDQMTNIVNVRKKVLNTFSERAIRSGEPMSTIEEVLVPIYLLHRYQIEAVAKSLGGLYFTHAIKNDGQVATKMVEPKEQWRAFQSLMSTITPDALALPEQLIQKIPPRPSGYPSSVETFSGYTGPTFDPIGAAEAAASTTLSYLLNPERAARLIEYKARDSKQPGLTAVINKLMEQTWWAPLPDDGYQAQLHQMVNNLVLKQLLQLAANTNAADAVRGEALLAITNLKEGFKNNISYNGRKQRGAVLFALSQISLFELDPNKFQPPPSAEMPPGAPIGMPALSFFNDDLDW